MNEYEVGNRFEYYGYLGWPDTPEPDIDPEFDTCAADWADMDEWEDEE